MFKHHALKRALPVLTMLAFLPSLAAAQVANDRTVFTPAEQKAICAANPYLLEGGVLMYGAGETEGSVSPDYSLECPGLRIQVQGRTVTVRAPSVAQALAVFSKDSYLLTYYADLQVRLEGEKLTVDPFSDLSEALLEDLFRVKVTVTPEGGQPHPLLAGRLISPYTPPAGQPYVISVETWGVFNPWPTVRIDPASGTVTATMAP